MSSSTSEQRRGSVGAVAAGGAGKRRLGWLWALLGLLALALIVAALLGAFSGDDDTSASAKKATLGTGSAQLLPVPSGGLGSLVGENANGQAVVVQSVVQNAENPDALEGFWVGTSKTDRVYVEYGGDVGTDEATFAPKVGEKVNLSGPVRPAPESPERTLNLDAEDAALVKQQGGYVNADQVTAAK
ncbi:MAG TPA: hypothetical protein VF533_06130 [Solirubrobacteraceae bacterium]|jgi:hypothetical protein